MAGVEDDKWDFNCDLSFLLNTEWLGLRCIEELLLALLAAPLEPRPPGDGDAERSRDAVDDAVASGWAVALPAPLDVTEEAGAEDKSRLVAAVEEPTIPCGVLGADRAVPAPPKLLDDLDLRSRKRFLTVCNRGSLTSFIITLLPFLLLLLLLVVVVPLKAATALFLLSPLLLSNPCTKHNILSFGSFFLLIVLTDNWWCPEAIKLLRL